MASSDIDICSQALLRIGEGTIQSFIEDSDAAEACANLYPDHRKYILSRHHWRFASKKRKLARLTEAPVNEYTYRFQLPSDLLSGPRAVYPSGDERARPLRDFEIFEKQLFANCDEIWIDFGILVLEPEWPAWFVELAVTSLAAKLAITITDKRSLSETLRLEAWGNPRFQEEGKFGVAKRLNAALTPPQSMIDDGGPLIAARWS